MLRRRDRDRRVHRHRARQAVRRHDPHAVDGRACRRRTPATRGRRWRSRRSRTSLYTRVMRHNPRDPKWPDRDRFVLSCGHASMLLYSILYLAGYDARASRTTSSASASSARRRAGHPEYGDLPGIEVTTGPLGQGISHARRDGARRADARGALQPSRPRDRRPPDVRDRLRRRPRGGDLRRGVLARRPPRPRPADRRSTTRTTSRSRATRSSRSPRTSASATRRTAGTSRTSSEDIGLDNLEQALADRDRRSRTGRR